MPKKAQVKRVVNQVVVEAPFIWTLIRKGWWIILVVILGIREIQHSSIKKALEDAQIQAGKFTTDLKLKNDEIARLRRSGSTVEWVTRTVTGNVLYSRLPYIPPEGGEEVLILKNPKTGVVTVQVTGKTWGFTVKPGIGMVYAGDKVMPQFDIKYFYWNRYSAEVGINPKFLGIEFSRHLDDMIPILRPQNAEAGLIGGPAYTGGLRFGLLLRTNL